MSSVQNRRSFLTQITGLAAGGAALAGVPSKAAGLQVGAPSGPVTEFKPPTWDLAWLDSFKGKYKQLYDLIWLTHKPNSINPPKNYLDVQKELRGLEFPDVNVAIGLVDIPINASDALWAKFKFGERWNIQDPETGKPAIRNVYLGTGPGDPRGTVKSLQARGVVFWMCNKSLNSLSRDLGRELGRPAGEVYAELVAGFNPGVKVVPAHTWAVGALQERGFTYERL